MKNKGTTFIIAIIVIILIFGVILLKMQSKKEEEKQEERDNNVENVIDERVETEEKYVEELDDGIKLNISEQLNTDKEVEGLKIENIQLTSQNGQTVILADVTNNTGKDIDVTLIDIILKDEQGNEIVKMNGIISPMKAGEVTKLNHTTTLDYANAYDIEIKIST